MCKQVFEILLTPHTAGPVMSSSSPEQSLTGTSTGLRVTDPHNISTTSITSSRSEGACIVESPIASALSPHQRATIASTSSTPSSPQLPSRGSTGKIHRGEFNCEGVINSVGDYLLINTYTYYSKLW